MFTVYPLKGPENRISFLLGAMGCYKNTHFSFKVRKGLVMSHERFCICVCFLTGLKLLFFMCEYLMLERKKFRFATKFSGRCLCVCRLNASALYATASSLASAQELVPHCSLRGVDLRDPTRTLAGDAFWPSFLLYTFTAPYPELPTHRYKELC